MTNINIDTPGASGANPTATASDVAVNGSAATFLRSDGAPAVQKGSSSVFGVVKVDNTTITASGGVITAVPGGGGVGNVTGPASSTDTAIATWNGTAGTALRNNSATLIDASGNISTTGKLSVTGNISGANIGNITPINLDGNGSHVLLGNGTFGTLSSGNVSGPGSSTNLAVVTWSGTTGTALLNNANATLTGSTTQYLDRSGNFSTPAGTGGSGSIYPAFTIPIDANYAWINQGNATVTVNANGGIYLLAPSSTINARIRKQAAPVTTPYTITIAALGAQHNLNFQFSGLVFRESSSGKLTTWGWERDSGASTVEVRHWASPTSQNATSSTVVLQAAAGVTWFRFTDDGTNLVYDWSLDGYNWITRFSELRGAFFTGTGFPNEVGFYANDQNNAGSPSAITLLSWAQT